MDYLVIELRRYTARPGQRAAFGLLFESWFPEVFRQLGAVVFGHFLERDRQDRFTWLRGYAGMDARLAVNTVFYDGPVWAEHKAALNGLVLDTDDVLLFVPALPDSGVPVLAAVDPLAESGGAQGVVAALLCKVRPDALDAFVPLAQTVLAACSAAGARPAGLLRTLAVPNNFPRHPIREDGTYMLLLCVVPGEAALRDLTPAFAALEEQGAALLDAPCELLVLDPCARSRLRWQEAA
jgi:hypothetical protein